MIFDIYYNYATKQTWSQAVGVPDLFVDIVQQDNVALLAAAVVVAVLLHLIIGGIIHWVRQVGRAGKQECTGMQNHEHRKYALNDI